MGEANQDILLGALINNITLIWMCGELWIDNKKILNCEINAEKLKVSKKASCRIKMLYKEYYSTAKGRWHKVPIFTLFLLSVTIVTTFPHGRSEKMDVSKILVFFFPPTINTLCAKDWGHIN